MADGEPDRVPDDATKRRSLEAAARLGKRVAELRTQRNRRVSEFARQVGVSPSLISQIERGQSRPSVSTLFGMAEALAVPVDAFFRDTHAHVAAKQAQPEPARGEPAGSRSGSGSGAGSAPGPDRPAGVAATATRSPSGGAPGRESWGSEAAPQRGEQRYVVRRDDRASLDIEGGVRWECLTPDRAEDFEFLELAYAPRAESNPTLYRHPGEEMVLVLSGRLDIYIGFERYALEAGDSIHFPSSFPHRYVNPTDQEARAVTVILHDGAGAPPSSPQGRP